MSTSSAHCRSSTTSTSGARSRALRRSGGPPRAISSLGTGSSVRPMIDARLPRTRSARSMPSDDRVELGDGVVARFAMLDPGRRLDELADRPVGDPLAIRQAARAQDRCALGDGPRASATSRLLPTPGAPVTVTSPGAASAATRSRQRPDNASRSAARPTNGVVVRRSIGSASLTATRRTALGAEPIVATEAPLAR